MQNSNQKPNQAITKPDEKNKSEAQAQPANQPKPEDVKKAE